MNAPHRRHALRRALSYLRPRWAAVSVIVALTLAGAIASALEPLLLRLVVDDLSSGGSLRVVLYGVAGLLGLSLLREALSALTNWLTWRTRLAIHFALLDETVGRLHTLPVGFHRNHGVGAIMTRLDRGIQGFLSAITELTFNTLPSVVYLFIAVGIMLQLDYRLALLVLGFAPLPAVLAARAASEQTRRERSLLDRWTKIYSRFNEVLSGIVTVRSYAMEDAEKQRFLGGVREANGLVLQGVRVDSRVAAQQGLVIALARISAIALGGYLVLRGDGTVGTLVAFLGYLTGLFGPVQGLTGVYRTIRKASVSIEDVFSILDEQDTLGDAPDARELNHLRGAVQFQNVTFSYRAEQAPILSGLDLTVEPGERIALVGPSGSGKSTMMALLQRFYDPTDGAILLDGWDLRSLKQASVRRQIGVVLQDGVLFDDTIRANIAYGRPEASFEEIVRAARAANAHEFIMRLPQGYDTPVGERGGRLSGGERQRISIARALLKDPPILILDEATSALDAESEELVQQALDRLVRGRTTFVIAHRLATVVDADRILVLRGGHIAEAGRHAELVNRRGYYATLVQKQLKGLSPTAAA
jgi:ATP-binding cassette subfamily B protein